MWTAVNTTTIKTIATRLRLRLLIPVPMPAFHAARPGLTEYVGISYAKKASGCQVYACFSRY